MKIKIFNNGLLKTIKENCAVEYKQKTFTCEGETYPVELSRKKGNVLILVSGLNRIYLEFESEEEVIDYRKKHEGA